MNVYKHIYLEQCFSDFSYVKYKSIYSVVTYNRKTMEAKLSTFLYIGNNTFLTTSKYSSYNGEYRSITISDKTESKLYYRYLNYENL